MWFIIVDKSGAKYIVNTQYITSFYFNGIDTNISVLNEDDILVSGDITRKMMEVLRMTGIAIKQIGD